MLCGARTDWAVRASVQPVQVRDNQALSAAPNLAPGDSVAKLTVGHRGPVPNVIQKAAPVGSGDHSERRIGARSAWSGDGIPTTPSEQIGRDQAHVIGNALLVERVERPGGPARSKPRPWDGLRHPSGRRRPEAWLTIRCPFACEDRQPTRNRRRNSSQNQAERPTGLCGIKSAVRRRGVTWCARYEP
jgi:hypothetical protein